jgi:hypothetical protein
MNYLSKDHHYDFSFATVDVHPKVISKLIAPIAKPIQPQIPAMMQKVVVPNPV